MACSQKGCIYPAGQSGLCAHHERMFEQPVARVTYNRWGTILSPLLQLTDGQEQAVDIPAGVDAKKFQSNLRSILSTGKGVSLIRWELRSFGDKITVRRVGLYEDAVAARGAKDVSREIEQAVERYAVALPNAVMEIPPPTTPTKTVVTTEERTIEHRSETVTTKTQEVVVSKPAPVPAAATKANGYAARFLASRDQSATAKEILDVVAKLWGPHASDNDFEDEDFDRLERLSEKMRAEQDASVQADQLVRLIEEEIEVPFNEKVYGIVASLIHGLCTEKRLLEFEIFRYCKMLRKMGDPCRADRVEELLPEEDRELLHKAEGAVA